MYDFTHLVVCMVCSETGLGSYGLAELGEPHEEQLEWWMCLWFCYVPIFRLKSDSA